MPPLETPHSDHVTIFYGDDETVGASNMAVHSGNRQSRMCGDASKEDIERHQLRTAQNTCLNREDRGR